MERVKGFFKNIGRSVRGFFRPTDGREAGFVTLYRKDSTKSILSSLICILGGLLVGFLVLFILALFNKDIPIGDAFLGLGILLSGPFSSGSGADVAFIFGDMLFKAGPLLMTGLSVAVAFKTGLFNIGAPGQYLVGAMASILVALSIPVPNKFVGFLVWLLALMVGALAGMLWGAIPGAFKAFLGVNEVIVCIMSNWVAANLVSWVFDGSRFINTSNGKSAYLIPAGSGGASTPKLGLDKIFRGSNIDIGILLATAIAVLIYIVMNKTTFGYELKACGYNRHAAKYAGMNEKRNILLSMMIAGALAGIGASLYYLNDKIEFVWNTYSKLPNDGFNGIPAALLASNHPIGVIFSAIFLRYLDKGGFNLSGYTGYNEYVSSMIVAVIIYFSGFSKLIRDLLSRKREKKAREAAVAAHTEDVAETTEDGEMPPAGDSGIGILPKTHDGADDESGEEA